MTTAIGQTIRVLRIRGWDRHYENNRTREVKRMSWVPVSTRLDSEGYTSLMAARNGVAYFGVWIALLEVASQCSPRGLLLKSDRTPHDPRSLARVTRMDPRTIRAALLALTRIKWLEEVDAPAVQVRQDRDVPAARLPSLTDIQTDIHGKADAAGGTGGTPPAAGRRNRRSRNHQPTPPEIAATLERMRGVRTGSESTPATTAEAAPTAVEGPARGYSLGPGVHACGPPRPFQRVRFKPRTGPRWSHDDGPD